MAAACHAFSGLSVSMVSVSPRRCCYAVTVAIGDGMPHTGHSHSALRYSQPSRLIALDICTARSSHGPPATTSERAAWRDKGRYVTRS